MSNACDGCGYPLEHGDSVHLDQGLVASHAGALTTTENCSECAHVSRVGCSEEGGIRLHRVVAHRWPAAVDDLCGGEIAGIVWTTMALRADAASTAT